MVGQLSAGVESPLIRVIRSYDGQGKRGEGHLAITPKGIPYFKIEARASKENEPHSENAGGSDAGWGGAATPARPWNQPSDQTADW